jgi:hypothetical protein
MANRRDAIPAVTRMARVIASAGLLALLTGFMLYFRIATYPYLASALAGSLVIHLWTRPGFRTIAITCLFAAGFLVIYRLVRGGAPWGSSLAFCGLGSIAYLGLTALWSNPEDRQLRVETCLKASMFPVFLGIAGFAVVVTIIAHPKTYDLYLYAFDAQLGVSPSFLVGRFLTHFTWLRQVCYIGYESLPLAMAVAFALDGAMPGGRSSGIVAAFITAAAGGFVLYNFCPAAGPVYLFGQQFPFAPPPAMPPPFRLADIAYAPRNAMPSVHIAMALLILWNSRRWAVGWRILAGALAVATFLATLGFGEHYLVDLFVAVPFALMAQGTAASRLGWNSRARIAAVGGGGAMVVAWLVYLRFPAPPLHMAGMWAWGLLTATAVFAVVLESRLNRATAAWALPARPQELPSRDCEGAVTLTSAG